MATDWDRAAGVPCAECGKEAYHLTRGLCDSCSTLATDRTNVQKILDSGRNLSPENLDALWTDEHQAFLEELTELAESKGLVFHPAFDLREWVIRVTADGKKCVLSPRASRGSENGSQGKAACPCADPVGKSSMFANMKCPLFRAGKTAP